jgi:inward rectifier potassium channel
LRLPNENTSAPSAGRRRARHPRARVRDLAGRRIIAEGLERNVWTDLYFNAMTMSWPAFVATLAAAFVALNFVFALVYALGRAPIANAREGSLVDLFFFSVETTSATATCIRRRSTGTWWRPPRTSPGSCCSP